MLDLRTPSSPHSTSSSMTSASPIAPKSSYAPALRPPFPQARSSPSPSSPDGRDSPASETSTATPKAICERHPHPARALSVQPARALPRCGHRGDSLASGADDRGRAMPLSGSGRLGHGWLTGRADIGWSNSLGWYEGFSLLTAVDPTGVITGFCFGAASTADQPLAETFFNLRANPNPRLISVGSAFWGAFVGYIGSPEGAENHRRWLDHYGADVIHPPKRNSKKRSWSKRLRRWVGGIRQIIETVYDKLFNTFGLWRERPHEIEGLRARLAARVALHNFCIWLNDQLGRPRLVFADLLGWCAHDSHQAFKRLKEESMTEQTTLAKPEAVCTAEEGTAFAGCAEHRRVYDAQARTEAWDFALAVLSPWVEGVEPIGSEELTRAMKEALEESEREFNRAQDELEAAEAAL